MRLFYLIPPSPVQRGTKILPCFITLNLSPAGGGIKGGGLGLFCTYPNLKATSSIITNN